MPYDRISLTVGLDIQETVLRLDIDNAKVLMAGAC